MKSGKKWKVPLWRLRTKRKPNVQFNTIQSQLKRTSKCFVINVECRFILLSFRILGFHSLFSPRRSLWFDEIIFRALAYEKTHSHTICTFPSDTHWLAGLIERTYFFHFFHWAWNAGFDGNHFQSSEIQTVFEFEFEERKKRHSSCSILLAILKKASGLLFPQMNQREIIKENSLITLAYVLSCV